MSRLSPITVAALTTAAAAVVGVGAYVVSRRRCAARVRDLAVPPPPLALEPPEGFEARWERRGVAAIDRCVEAPDVLSFSQAVACALNSAYPESSPWIDPAVWTPWMRSAADLVERDLAAEAGDPAGNPRAWEIAIWLRGRAEVASCRAAQRARGRFPRIVALCAARRIYPGAAWDRPRAPWQQEMLAALIDLAQEAA